MSTETEKLAGNGAPATARHPQPRVSTEFAAGTERKLAVAVCVLAVLLIIGFTIAFMVRRHHEEAAKRLALAAEDAKPVVDVVAVQPTEKNYPLELPGQTAGWYQSTIFARVDGYVGSWSADIGDRVKQGQVLANIDTPDLDQQLIGARAGPLRLMRKCRLQKQASQSPKSRMNAGETRPREWSLSRSGKRRKRITTKPSPGSQPPRRRHGWMRQMSVVTSRLKSSRKWLAIRWRYHRPPCRRRRPG